MAKGDKIVRVYGIYDSRACGAQGTDDAVLFVTCNSKTEARKQRGPWGAIACYSHLVKYPAGRHEGIAIEDERWEWDWYPGDPK